MPSVATTSFLPKYFSYKKISVYVANINTGVMPKFITLKESEKRPKIKTKTLTFIFLNTKRIAIEKRKIRGNEKNDDSINRNKKPITTKKDDN